jgi:hypothetical protein
MISARVGVSAALSLIGFDPTKTRGGDEAVGSTSASSLKARGAVVVEAGARENGEVFGAYEEVAADASGSSVALRALIGAVIASALLTATFIPNAPVRAGLPKVDPAAGCLIAEAERSVPLAMRGTLTPRSLSARLAVVVLLLWAKAACTALWFIMLR